MKRSLIGGFFFLGGAFMFAIGQGTDSLLTLAGIAFGVLGTVILMFELFSKEK
ncbi:MAG: hypothetical protein LBR54_03585 [Oscillospiraceae bacterium]|jgi:hypothetical protein|nr:hypothetical protein [Oscillospiraceae bacterium]